VPSKERNLCQSLLTSNHYAIQPLKMSDIFFSRANSKALALLMKENIATRQ
jgi:hypothetical protein